MVSTIERSGTALGNRCPIYYAEVLHGSIQISTSITRSQDAGARQIHLGLRNASRSFWSYRTQSISPVPWHDDLWLSVR